MNTKKCSRCRQDLPFDAFNKNKRKPSGLQDKCRECQRAFDKEYYDANPSRRNNIRAYASKGLRRNREYIGNYLKEHPCVDCGESDPVVLHFDHVRGVKLANVTDFCRPVGLRSLNKLKEEIDKCEVRCANCHARKTARDFGWWSLKFNGE